MNAHCVCLISLVLLVMLPVHATEAANLAGRVMDDAQSPIQSATVFVYTAAPKSGTSTICPSCYPDCGKTAETDAEGRYSFAGLSDTLTFRLLVVAQGYQPVFMPGISAGDKNVAVTMTPRRNDDVPAGQTARGRVLDRHGVQIHGAIVEVQGVDFGDGRRRWGRSPQEDPLAVTDETGEFVLATRDSVTALMVRVSARGYADRNVRLELGENSTISLAPGATLVGRVLHDGKPVPNLAVGVAGMDRAAGEYAGHFEVGTDADGRFRLTNLPAKTDYYFYGLMNSVGVHGAIPIRPVYIGRDGGTTDVGDISIGSGYRLAGRVVLADGGKIPPDTRLTISRHEARDSATIPLGEGGEFAVQGLPAETVALYVRLPGYRVSSKNRSCDPLNTRLLGKMVGDVSGLELLLEAGEPVSGLIRVARPPSHPSGLPLKDRLLRGVEGD